MHRTCWTGVVSWNVCKFFTKVFLFAYIAIAFFFLLLAVKYNFNSLKYSIEFRFSLVSWRLFGCFIFKFYFGSFFLFPDRLREVYKLFDWYNSFSAIKSQYYYSIKENSVLNMMLLWCITYLWFAFFVFGDSSKCLRIRSPTA